MFGGADTFEEPLNQVKSEFQSLTDVGKTPDAAVVVPDTWATFDPGRDDAGAFLQELRAKHPDAAGALDGGLSPPSGIELSLAAFDRQAPGHSPTTLNMLKQELGWPTSIQAQMSSVQQQLAARGITVVSTNADLSIGGFPTGRSETRFTDSGIDLAGVQYAILPEPDLVFILTFVTTPDRIGELTPVFEQIAGSFRLS